MAGADNFTITVLQTAGQAAEGGPPTERLRIPWRGEVKEVDPEKFRQAYEGMLEAIRYMSRKAQGAVEGFAVDEISFHLGVTAEGGLSFVAKAGLEADIDIKIKRM